MTRRMMSAHMCSNNVVSFAAPRRIIGILSCAVSRTRALMRALIRCFAVAPEGHRGCVIAERRRATLQEMTNRQRRIS